MSRFGTRFASRFPGRFGSRFDDGGSPHNLGQGVGAPLLPLNAVTTLIGDSHMRQELSYISANNGDMEGRFGWATMARQIAKSPGYIPVRANYGADGAVIQDMIDNIATPMALSPAMVFMSILGNNIPGKTIADLSALLAKLDEALGLIWTWNNTVADGLGTKYVLMTTVGLRFSPTTFTAPEEVLRQAINAGIKARASRRLKVIDLDQIITTAGQVPDGTHVAGPGAVQIAAVAGPVLAAMFVASDAASLLAPGSAVIPSLAGSSAGGITGTAAGVAPTGMTLNGAAGGVVTGSKDGADDKPILVLSGSKTGSNVLSRLRSTKSAAQWGITLVAGDAVQGIIDFEVLTAFSGVGSLEIEINILDSGFATTYLTLRGLHVFASEGVLPPGRYTMRTPPGVIRAGTPANMNIDANMNYLNGSVSTAGSWKIYNMGLQKVS